DAQHLYWSNGLRLMSSDLDGKNIKQLATLTIAIHQLAVDTEYLYLGVGRFIGRIKLDGTGYDAEWLTLTEAAFGIAVDARHIYWTGQPGIGRANLDGSEPDNAFIPGALGGNVAVDGQYVYWSNATAGTIGRAN